jgi:hypothetical protein
MASPRLAVADRGFNRDDEGDGMTWDEICEKCRESFNLTRDMPELLELVWSFRNKENDGEIRMEQRVLRGRGPFDGYIMVISPVLPENVRPARDALSHNMTTPVGALALQDGHYFMRHFARLEDLAFPSLRRDMELLAIEAARLRTFPDETFEKISFAE